MAGTVSGFISPSITPDNDFKPEGRIEEFIALQASSNLSVVTAGSHISYVAVKPSANGKKYDLDWALGPFKAKISLDVTTLSIYIYISVKVPILGNVKIAEMNGNLKDGVQIKFGIAVASGTFTFYLKNKRELWVRVQVQAFSIGYNGDYKIFTFW